MSAAVALRAAWTALRAQVEVAAALTSTYALNGARVGSLVAHPDFSRLEMAAAVHALVEARIATLGSDGRLRLDESPLVFRRADLLAARATLARRRWSASGLADRDGLYAAGIAQSVGEVARLEGELAAEEARARAPT